MKDKLNKKEVLENLKKTWKYAKTQKKNLIKFTILAIMLTLIGAIAPILSAQIVLKISGGLYQELIQIGLLILAIEITRNIVRFFTDKISQIIFRETMVILQTELAKETLLLETKEIDKNNSGVFIDRINKDVNEISFIFGQLNSSVTSMATNIGILVAVFIVSKWMFFYFLLAIIIISFFKRLQIIKFYQLDKDRRIINEKNTGLITELVRGIRDIKVLNANDNFIKKTNQKLIDSNNMNYEMFSIKRKYDLLAGNIMDIANFMFLILGIYLASKNLLTIPSFVVLYMYQNRIYNLLSIVTDFYERLKNYNLSAGRVFEILDSDKFSKETFGNEKISKIKGDFEFKNVNFAYDNGLAVLNNFNLKVNANETVSFVGKSGSGKSTIFSLLTKLYKVENGELLIDGININDLDKDSIRNNISIITQTPYIFNMTIKENLKMVNEKLKDKEIIETCKLACFHDFVMTLPDKYDTKIGEGGMTLSGGQRQRLAIARALLKKTEIILFDEATSALDNETQSSIQKAISNMKNHNTILIIAHRLSTVLDSDRIVLIEEGEIISEGTHQQLLETCKTYQKLYETELLS